MKYHSLSGSETQKSLKDIAFQATALDGSLFFPNEFPSIDMNYIRELPNMDFHEVATKFLHPYLEEFFTEQQTLRIGKGGNQFPLRVGEGI